MEKIQSLEKSDLLKRTQDLAAIERHTTLELIEHLREIERRMLFLELGYSTLFEFAVKHLAFSEGSAQRRISAMRLIQDVPEAKEKLESGAISLSNASQVQTAFRSSKSKRSIAEKKEALNKISGMTQRECQKTLLQLVPEAAPKLMERERQVSEERFELKLVISKELHEEIEKLKDLLSHSLQDGGNSELIGYLVKQELKRQEKKRGLVQDPVKETPLSAETSSSMDATSPVDATVSVSAIFSTAAPVQTETKRSRKAISRVIQRKIWKRAEGRCEAIEKTGRCTSRHRLELDHAIPHAQGGSDSFENLRLYCRAHNVKHAIEDYGTELMSFYRR
jgi:5-methylcytosine-specific restriction endonuclease McrA